LVQWEKPSVTIPLHQQLPGGAGLLLYGIFNQMNRHGAVKKESREQKSRPDMTMEILSQVIPLVTPYIAGYLENYMKGES
jgi:hypothetical protein